MSQALAVEKSRSGILEFQEKTGPRQCLCAGMQFGKRREEKQKEHGSQVGCPDTTLWIVRKGSGKDQQTLPRMSVE